MGDRLTDLVTQHVAAATFESLPPSAVSRAKVRLLDALGLIAAGQRALGSDDVISLVRDWGGRADATVFTTSHRVPAMHAALANAVLMRSYDFEPVGADRSDGVQIPAHITGTTIPVALAVAEATGASGRDLLTALVVGDDIAARLGHAVGFDVYGGGDNTGTINVIGGTLVAATLMDLDAEGMRRALGLAINQVGGTIDNINDKTLAFKLPIALSARNSIFSAELAASGFGGPVDPLGGRFGFLAQWSRDPKVSAITDGLGEEYFADAVIKPWPACRASHPSIDATVRLIERVGLQPRDIEQCRVHVNPKTKNGFVGQPFVVGESPEVSGAFSILFGVATSLLHGTVSFRHLTLEHMEDPAFTRMLERVELVDSLAPDVVSTAEIEVTTASGETHRERVAGALGDINFNPQSEAAIDAKFAASIAWAGLPAERGKRIHELVADFETLDDVRELSTLLER